MNYMKKTRTQLELDLTRVIINSIQTQIQQAEFAPSKTQINSSDE